MRTLIRGRWKRIAFVIAPLMLLCLGLLLFVGVDQYESLRVANRDGKREAERLITSIAPLQELVGGQRTYGFVWHASYDWLDPFGGELTAYIPVRGSRTSGTLYIRDWNDIGAYKIRDICFNPKGSSTCIDFKKDISQKVFYGG